jgi:hypothetical protein
MTLTREDLVVLAALIVVARADDRLRALAGPPSAESARAVLRAELASMMKRMGA